MNDEELKPKLLNRARLGRTDELNPEDEIVVQCHHGRRSMKAAAILKEKGFKNVVNLKGGIDEWAEKFDPDMARY